MLFTLNETSLRLFWEHAGLLLYEARNLRLEDPYDVSTTATKRPLSTLLAQMSLEAAKQVRTFNESDFFDKLEEVVAVLLMAFVPILTATHTRVGKEVQKTKRDHSSFLTGGGGTG